MRRWIVCGAVAVLIGVAVAVPVGSGPGDVAPDPTGADWLALSPAQRVAYAKGAIAYFNCPATEDADAVALAVTEAAVNAGQNATVSELLVLQLSRDGCPVPG